MKLLFVAADGPLGGVLCQQLVAEHEVVSVGRAQESDLPAYICADVCDRQVVESLLKGVEGIVHALPYDATLGSGVQAEQELLDYVARSTFVLATAACAAQVGRLVLISKLDLMRSYDERFVVTPQWQPKPSADAESLAPHMAELAAREVARTGRIEVVALRFGKLGAETSAEDAGSAVQEALTAAMPNHYHWSLRHVASSGRFAK